MQLKRPHISKVKINVKEYMIDRSDSIPKHNKHITFMNSDDFKNEQTFLNKENCDINKHYQTEK